ncbi:GNAT family N-acetyltransferase [Flavobacterium sp.]|uniref:GNAT family N-acetyltransferase n=1 Tax=Flavobacterium sp. TaxID=239 RepID=UPI004033B0FA
MPDTFGSQRLLFRELLASDDIKMFELDSSADVHRYLGNKPLQAIGESREVINGIRQQYLSNGIGRMAVIIKDTGEFIGWAGLKLEHDVNGHDKFYDVGYRLLPQYWGRGYATEAAVAFIDHGFRSLGFQKINACALTGNAASRKVLEKAGMQLIEEFTFTGKYEGEKAVWYEIHNPLLWHGPKGTSRLLFRKIDHDDAQSLYEMDSDPEVHRYLGNAPVRSMDEIKTAIAMIRKQYEENGVARMAVILKETGEFLGWAGLKLVRQEINGHTNYYDLGYRFMKKHWGKGYATEAAKAFVDHGFNMMFLSKINAYADAGNVNSHAVLEKARLLKMGTFDDDGVPSVWYEIVNPAAL